MKIAIAGATGLVGTALIQRLHRDGDSLVVLTRNGDRARRQFPAATYPRLEIVPYQPQESGPWQEAIAGCDGVVNLAGAAIADERWTEARKRELRNSRIVTTQKLVEAIAQAPQKPRVFVSGSAIGYYGASETAEFDESSPAGRDFLAQLCQDWEAAAQGAIGSGVRLVTLRTGIVLGNGGALGKMLLPFQLFAGGPIGTGRQWVSWIHEDDLAALIARALKDDRFSGIYNGTAPNPVSMTALCSAVGRAMGRPSWLPVPAFALELLLGEGAKVILEGQKVLPKQAIAAGFNFQYETVEPAVAAVVASGR
ncbi:MAG: TIGR01777 family oxidoreductase [Cyanobacteria bacterium]|nr:TIGR01777 family oxidoreductase [Cyanobacteriota bacterium]